MIGYLGKGIAIGVVGILLGLALRTLAAQPFGMVLLVAVAIGFAAYGVYCFAAARSHRT